ARQLATAGPAVQARLEAAFGDRATFDAFMNAVKREATLSRLRAASASAAPGAPAVNGFDVARELAGIATHSAYGRVMGAAMPLMRMLGRAGSAPPDAVGDLLLSRGDAI